MSRILNGVQGSSIFLLLNIVNDRERLRISIDFGLFLGSNVHGEQGARFEANTELEKGRKNECVLMCFVCFIGVFVCSECVQSVFKNVFAGRSPES